jgi:hypothetical protein
MTLHWGEQYWDQVLPESIKYRIQTVQADPNFSYPEQDAYQFPPIHNGKTGELLGKARGSRSIRVSRGKMRNLFSEGLDVQVVTSPAHTNISGDFG